VVTPFDGPVLATERRQVEEMASLSADGFGELPGLPRAASEFAQDMPGFELGVGAFAWAAQLGVGAVGSLLGGRFVLPLVGVRMWSPAPV